MCPPPGSKEHVPPLQGFGLHASSVEKMRAAEKRILLYHRPVKLNDEQGEMLQTHTLRVKKIGMIHTKVEDEAR